MIIFLEFIQPAVIVGYREAITDTSLTFFFGQDLTKLLKTYGQKRPPYNLEIDKGFTSGKKFYKK